ncbi:MAG: glycoside hydrolase family 13 protein [Kiritimatiellia bacterium]
MKNRKVVPEFPPAWAADAVWYQIFPERFRNGCSSSDPRAEDISGTPVPGWEITPWGKDWYSLSPWEADAGGFQKSVFMRRYGGDLVGVCEKLDYLQHLGVTAIYLNPIFISPSLHKYDGSTYHHIDPALGPDREGDLRLLAEANETEDPGTWIWTAADRFFLEMVRDIHARGMRIIIDGVFNHTGTEFFAFRDLKAKGPASRYKDWYRDVHWDENGTLHYKGWFGHAGLPELGRSKYNLAEPVINYIFAATRRWMAPNGSACEGIDGWRLDVAFCVPHGFWREWRALVKSINPSAFLCGEIVKLATPYLQGDELDSVMNYMWSYPVISFFSPSPKPMPAGSLRRRLDQIFDAYGFEVCLGLQNLLDSHDTGRILTMLENPGRPLKKWDEYFNVARTDARPGLVTTKPGEKALAALRQIIVFQMTFPGAPMIYYGTEAGMWGANDPDDRQPMLWDDIVYEDETHTHSGACGPNERSPDKELFAHYQKAIALRKEHLVLSRGAIRWDPSARGRLLGFIRHDADSEILALFNSSDRVKYYDLGQPAMDLWGQGAPVAAGRIQIAPRGWRVLLC